MRMTFWSKYTVAAVVCLLPVAGCSSADGSGTGASTGSTTSSGTTSTSTTSSSTGGGGDTQTPPQGEANVKAWLALGYYKSWHCESAPSPMTVPASPHGERRVCTNDALATATTKPWPVGAAAVKELYHADAGAIIGYAVYLKTGDDATAGGAAWYWYEDDPDFNPAGGVVADGLGTAGTPAATVCVSCHSAAGIDTTTHAGAGDQVYVRVTQ